MERFDIEQPPWGRTNSNAGKVTITTTTHRLENLHFVPLRKYTTAICLVEALIIAFMVYLLIKLPPAPAEMEKRGNVSDLNQPYRTYYSAELGFSVAVMPGLVPDCNQRVHDVKYSVQCGSSDIGACVPPMIKQMEVGLDEEGSESVDIYATTKQGQRLAHHRLVPQTIECDHQAEKPAGRCRFGTRIELDREAPLRQRIIGWGGALTDSSINNILSLTVNGTRRLLDDYFGEDGLRFNMVRVTIGGSDFSARFYTNDDNERYENPEAHLLRAFKLRSEDHLYKIPLLRAIQTAYSGVRGESLKYFASMWSPPVWMKTNAHFNKGQLRGSISSSTMTNNPAERFYKALAQLKMKWLEQYAERGVHFWGLTVMNEPIFAVQPFLGFNTMIFPREDYANYVAKYLGPSLRNHPETREIKLMVHDDNRRFLMNFTLPLLEEERVRKFVDGISVHGYIDQDYDQMDYLYNQYESHELFVLPTELCSGHLPFMEKALVGNWHRGVHYALDIIGSLQHSAAGWVDWNMVLDTEGGPGWLGGRLDAPIIVDKARDVYHKSPMFYVLGQFSRFIPPGSQRVATKLVNGIYDNQLETVTFRVPPDSIQAPRTKKFTTVVVNNNAYPVQVMLNKASSGQGGALEARYQTLEVPADSVISILHD